VDPVAAPLPAREHESEAEPAAATPTSTEEPDASSTTPAPPREFGGRAPAWPADIAASPDGQWIATGDLSRVCVFDANTWERRWSTKIPSVHRLVFTADSRTLVFAGRGAVRVVRIADGSWEESRVIELSGGLPIRADRAPLHLSLDREGTEAVLVMDERVVRVRLDGSSPTPTAVRETAAHDCFVFPDGSVAVTQATKFETDIISQDGSLRTVEGRIEELSPDGTTCLLSHPDRSGGSGLRLQIARCSDMHATGAFRIDPSPSPKSRPWQRPLVMAKFSPRGRWLVTVEHGTVAVVRDATTGNAVRVLDAYAGAYPREQYAAAAAWSADGEWLLTAGRRKAADEFVHGTLAWHRPWTSSDGENR